MSLFAILPTFTTETDGLYGLSFRKTDNTAFNLTNIQIEEGSTATSYEPFKSNILTVNEPVELRGIGDVKDELDLLTGELTQRVGEVVLDGTQQYSEHINTENYFCVRIPVELYPRVGSKEIICDKLNRISYGVYFEAMDEGVSLYEGNASYITNVYLSLNKNRFNGEVTLNDVINWLSKNNLTIQYELAQESIKTVDLSDNVVYSYDEVTHYDCSSEDGSLVPTVAVKVPTDVQAVITDQSATIQTLEQENQALKKTQDTLLVVQLGMMEHMATTLAESEEQPTYLKALRQLASERGLI